MISPTFQRISYSPVQEKIFSSSSASPSIIYPSTENQNDLIPAVCLAQPYDEICIFTSDTSTRSMSYPNVSLLTYLPPKKQQLSSLSSSLYTSLQTIPYSTSTISYNFSTLLSINSTSNLTHHDGIPPLIVSVRSPTSNRFRSLFSKQRIWIILSPILCGILCCLLFALCAYIKYRRKDVGVYEVEEAQRFRPLIVELTPSPGERNQDNPNSTTTTSLSTSVAPHGSKQDNTKSHKNRKGKKSPLTTNDEQREFYI